MRIGLCTVSIYLPTAQSLKDRRKVVHRVKDRVRARFNVSLCEVGDTDQHRRAELAIVSVAPSQAELDRRLSSLESELERLLPGELVGFDVEVLD